MDDTCIFNRALSAGEILYLASGEPCSAPPPLSSVCLTLSIKNRSREALQDFSVPTILEIRKPTGEIALSGIFTPLKDGTIRITDASLLQNLENTTSYSISAKPVSHQRRKLSNVTNILDGVCRPLPGSIVGDFSAAGDVTLANITRAIRHFQRNDDAIVSGAYASQRLTLRHLIDLIRSYLTKAGKDE